MIFKICEDSLFQEALNNSRKTEYENAQETSTLCHAISTALPKFENQGQDILNANTQRDIQGAN